MNRNQTTKRLALTEHLTAFKNEIEVSTYDDDTFECGSEEYLVLTDKEADVKCRESILDSVWAFNSSFLACHLKKGIDESVIKSIQENNKCEDNNTAILSLIRDVDHFVDDAVKCDGRGHFLSSYDSEEKEVVCNGKYYFIYRRN